MSFDHWDPGVVRRKPRLDIINFMIKNLILLGKENNMPPPRQLTFDPNKQPNYSRWTLENTQWGNYSPGGKLFILQFEWITSHGACQNLELWRGAELRSTSHGKEWVRDDKFPLYHMRARRPHADYYLLPHVSGSDVTWEHVWSDYHPTPLDALQDLEIQMYGWLEGMGVQFLEQPDVLIKARDHLSGRD